MKLTILTLCLGGLGATSDDFEVSVFLTETNTRHSLLFKHKHFRDTTQTRLTSNTSKLTGGGASLDVPSDVEQQLHQQQGRLDHDDGSPPPAVPPGLRIEDNDDDDDVIVLHDIPIRDQDETTAAAFTRFAAAHRRSGGSESGGGDGGDRDISAFDNAADRSESDGSDRHPGSGSGSDNGSDLYREELDHNHDYDGAVDDGGSLFVDQHQELAEFAPAEVTRKHGASDPHGQEHGPGDDKKKLAMDISYEGFSIYGRVLCLVVKRREGDAGGGIGATGARGGKGKAAAASAASISASSAGRGNRAPSGQATMANWIASTQIPDTAESGLLDT